MKIYHDGDDEYYDVDWIGPIQGYPLPYQTNNFDCDDSNEAKM